MERGPTERVCLEDLGGALKSDGLKRPENVKFCNMARRGVGPPDDLEEPESAFALARRSSDSVRKYMCAEDADSVARDPCGNELPWDEDESDDGVPLTE